MDSPPTPEKIKWALCGTAGGISLEKEKFRKEEGGQGLILFHKVQGIEIEVMGNHNFLRFSLRMF
jgi:hypothetical protein